MVNKPLEKIPFEFVFGKETAPGEIQLVRGCYTEKELKEIYRVWLIQCDEDSEKHFPYHRLEGTLYVPMTDLAFEVEEELIEERKRNQGTENPHRYIM